MSSAFLMLLLDELPEGWVLELPDPDEWAETDAVDHEVDAPATRTADEL